MNIRELKHETFLSHGRQPEVISKAKVTSHATDLRRQTSKLRFCITDKTAKTPEVDYMSSKYIVKNICLVFLSLLDSQLANSIDLKKVIFFCQLHRIWEGVLQMPFHVHLCGILLFVSEKSKIFQSDAEPQLTPADHFSKMKFALHSELSISANSNWS